MKDKSQKTTGMGKEFIIIAMEISILAIGRMTSSMEWESTYSQMESAMRENFNMELKMAVEFTSMSTVIAMRGVGKKIRKMVKEFTFT